MIFANHSGSILNRQMLRTTLFIALTLLAQQTYAEPDVKPLAVESPPTVETPLERSSRILKEVNAQFENQRRPSAPNLNHFPQPATNLSPAEVAKQFSQQPIIFPTQKAAHELMIFVSFSMPPESLQRIVEQSARTGAHIVFRGFKGDKMMDMSKHIAELIGKHRVEISVNPPAFTQFKITHVPALVIAQPNASEQMSDGCALPTRYVKVTGDVGQSYALDLIERTSPQFAVAAQGFNRRISGSIQ